VPAWFFFATNNRAALLCVMIGGQPAVCSSMCLLGVRTVSAACPAVRGWHDYGVARRRPTCSSNCPDGTISAASIRNAGCGKYEKGAVASKIKLGACRCKLPFAGQSSPTSPRDTG
jgi:hypothetical protein